MAFAEVEQPKTFAERGVLARRIRDELEVPLPIFVDGMDDASRALFSDLPSPAFVIDRQGRIADKLPWADPELLRQCVASIAAKESVPDSKTAAWTLDQRDAFARRLVVAGQHGEALAWLDATSDPAPSVPPTLVATARAAITRVLALRAADPQARRAAITAAEQSAVTAWSKDSGRLTSARIELAGAASDKAAANALWQAALAGLDARAPLATSQWIRSKIDPVNDKR